MSLKHNKVAAILEAFKGRSMDPHYLGYFECFNHQLFFEAHEVLEPRWLAERGGPDDRFFKGLIQLAGAFVHVQKQRPGPAAALFRLAKANLSQYPDVHYRLDVAGVIRLIEDWLAAETILHRADRPYPALQILD